MVHTHNVGTQTTHRFNAAVTGIFFIVAAASSIAGLLLYTPLLQPADYLVQGALHARHIVSGALLELVLACSAAGTGIMLFPYLKRYSITMGLGYLVFRLLEVLFILVGLLCMLSLLSLSKAYTAGGMQFISSFRPAGVALRAAHDWTFMLGPNFMLGINTFLYSYVLYRSRLVPRGIAALGIAGAIIIFAAAIFEMFGIFNQLSPTGMLMGVPIFLYEMTLAVWLLVKGYDEKQLRVL
ncbi:MAG: DUF4386 domain-containing protein [Flavipsychrobacter sp.]|nr:DUF4386 domain-containing protein [Flavipsychrobacter sp.]